MTVKNNLPVPVRLAMNPAPSLLFAEKQACYDRGYDDNTYPTKITVLP